MSTDKVRPDQGQRWLCLKNNVIYQTVGVVNEFAEDKVKRPERVIYGRKTERGEEIWDHLLETWHLKFLLIKGE